MKRIIYLALLTLLVSGCGGGSSSGGGTTQGFPAPTAFAGSYPGFFSMTFQGTTVSQPATITVSSNGQFGFNAQQQAGAACIVDSEGTNFLAGDRIGLSLTGNCFLPSIGTCTTFMQGEIVFSQTSAVGGGPFSMNCPSTGTLNATWSIGATKV